MVPRQLKMYGFALVTGLCGVVLGVFVGVGTVFLFGHLSSALLGILHLTFTRLAYLTGLAGFLAGLKLGYKKAEGRFLN